MPPEDRRPLTKAEIYEALKGLAGWTIVGGKLHRKYRFRDFKEAFGWMTSAALAAEKADHHPDWANSWRDVTIDLITHDAAAITKKDVDLAAILEEMAARILSPPRNATH